MTGSVLVPIARPTLLGSARRDGGAIVFTCTGVDSTRILAAENPKIGLELAHVRDVAGAVRFVDRYGPLGELDPRVLSWFGQETVRAVSKFHEPIVLRQPVQDLLFEAQRLNTLLTAASDARRAATDADADARDRLLRYRDYFKIDEWDLLVTKIPPGTLISQEVTSAISAHLRSVRPLIATTGPGTFEIRLVAETLLDSCYLNIAEHLTEQERLEVCPECARVFIAEDGRQKFCEPKCAGRARFRRFSEQRKTKVKE